MRTKAIVLSSSLLCALMLSPHPAEARARGGGGGPGGLGASSVGFSGNAVIGAHASPYYVAPYGYAPAYYHSAANYSYSGYGYGGTMPAAKGASYAYSVGAPCWNRRQAIYGTYGEVASVRNNYVCQ